MLSADRQARIRAQYEAALRRFETIRCRTGRLGTLAGTTAAAVTLADPNAFGESLLGTVVVTGGSLLLLPTSRATSRHHAHTTLALRLLPGVSLAGLLITEATISGIHWGEILAIAVWSAGTWLLRPAKTARRMLVPPLPPLTVPEPGEDLVAVAPEVTDDHPAALWWAEQVAGEDGAAPGTVLEDIERSGEQSMRAVIRSASPGRPVPDISLRHLSAVMDIPEELIKITPVPGRGASVRQLAVGEERATDPATIWAERIAPLAMPGAKITAINFGRMATDMTSR